MAKEWLICLNLFEDLENVHILNDCQHMFHSECLKNWYLMLTTSTSLACPKWGVDATDRSMCNYLISDENI